ncbi:MAG: SRPBCC family protein, partial [Candidatus Sericytochromatia bacterium]|nr:SRPBCC family protein [Candidatus Tanganyikabacteria bacterium]
MKNPFVRLLIVALLFGSIPAVVFLVAGLTAPEQIRSEHSTTVLAPPARVWNVVTNWETMGSGMHKMMPKVGKRKVMGAPEPEAGVVVRYPLADGRNWDQRIVTWEPQKGYSFRNEQGAAAGMPG